MLFGIVNRRLAARQLEIRVLPRRDYLQTRIKCHICQLEPNLIVTLTRRSMRYTHSTLGMGNLDLVFGNQGPGYTGTKKITVLINRTGLEKWPDIVLDKLLAKVLDDAFDRLDTEQKLEAAGRRMNA